MTRRDLVLAQASDLPANFLYYDRKEDEELPAGEIEAAIAAGEVSVEEILAPLAEALRRLDTK